MRGASESMRKGFVRSLKGRASRSGTGRKRSAFQVSGSKVLETSADGIGELGNGFLDLYRVIVGLGFIYLELHELYKELQLWFAVIPL